MGELESKASQTDRELGGALDVEASTAPSRPLSSTIIPRCLEPNPLFPCWLGQNAHRLRRREKQFRKAGGEGSGADKDALALMQTGGARVSLCQPRRP